MNARRVWGGATIAVVLIGIVGRFFVNFSYPYPPGVNAAYYPLQARAWLLHGRLMYDDLPLLFWIDAGVGRAIAAAGVPLDNALLLATRIVDSIVEPFTAVAVLAFGYVWSGGRLRALPGSVAAALLVILSPPILRMLSDFEKNSVGLGLMSGALWTCRSAMVAQRPRSWVLLGAILCVAALTHVGAFAFASILVAIAIGLWIAFGRRLRPAVVAVGFFTAAMSVGILAATDLHRLERLARAPVAIFLSGGIDTVPSGAVAVAALLVGIALRLAWRERRVLDPADLAIVGSLAFMLAIVALPKSYVYFDRLMLMAPVPAAILLTFCIARSRRGDVWVGGALLAVATLVALHASESVQRPLMNEAVATELRQLEARIPDPDRTLVVAAHGFEWWAGFILGTRVRSELPSLWNGYTRVLFLRNTVDCPADVVSPFAAPEIPEGGTRIFTGKYVELYEAR